jgi:hypothetical protein
MSKHAVKHKCKMIFSCLKQEKEQEFGVTDHVIFLFLTVLSCYKFS